MKPHLLKFLQVHLKLKRSLEPGGELEDYVLTNSGLWGLPLTQLLRRPAKSARHEASIEDCTVSLGINLRNFKGDYYDLLQGKLSAYAIFQWNDFVEDQYYRELYWWVHKHRERRATIKDGIRAFLAFYEVSEDECAFETLRKNVQRNAGLPSRKNKKKKDKKGNFPVNLSQKTSALSQKTGALSQKTGVLSQKDTFAAVRQELMKLPLPLFETDFFYGGR